MTFVLLPAVDVAGGLVARRSSGDGSPLAAALAWQADGADWIHLVDLDAAFKRGSNLDLLRSMVDRLDLAVEVAGGITDADSLDGALSTGCDRVVLATTALDDRAWCSRVMAEHGGRVAVALDVRVVEQADGSVAHRLVARGATHDSGDLWEAIDWLDEAGCARYIVTDVRADGMLAGPNLDLCRAVAAATGTPVVVSGGISSIDDLTALVDLAATASTIEGAIVGRALHDGRFTLRDALAVTTRGSGRAGSSSSPSR